MRFYCILANHNKSSDRIKVSTIYSWSRAWKTRNVRGIIMCTYTRSRASKEVSETHHMYLLTIMCNKINELTCSVCNMHIHLILVESNIWPRSCAMKPSDEDYVFHLYSQPVLLRKVEPGIDMLSYPFVELVLGEGVLMPSRDGKGQHSTILASACKRDFHSAWGCRPEGTSATSA